MRVTLEETLVGFAIALVLGIGLGTLLGRVAWLEQAMRPVIVASQVVPKVALIPLFIIWFGFGITSKIIIVALLSFFPILLNVILGVRSVDSGHRDVMRSLNAGRWQTFRTIALPGAAPLIMAGVKLGVGLGLVLIAIAEMIGAQSGIGYMIWNAWQLMAVDTMFVGLIVIALLGFAFTWALDEIERWLLPWKARG